VVCHALIPLGSQKDKATTRATLGFSIAGMQRYDSSTRTMRKHSKQECRAIRDATQLKLALRGFFSNAPGGAGEHVLDVCGGEHGVVSRLKALAAWCVVGFRRSPRTSLAAGRRRRAGRICHSGRSELISTMRVFNSHGSPVICTSQPGTCVTWVFETLAIWFRLCRFSEQRLYHFTSASVLVLYEGERGAEAESADAAAGEEAEEAGEADGRRGPAPFRVRVCFVDFAHAIDAEGQTDTNVHQGLLSLIGILDDLAAER
jgi:hypothetical protein